jgi:hypothetical protein
VTVEGELQRARHLTFAAEEMAAKDVLLSLCDEIERDGRDDLMLEVHAQLGEIYLVRTAYNGTEECLRRMRDLMASYSVADRDTTILRYTRRAQFLETGLAAAHGDHEAAEIALFVLTADASDADPPALADEHRFLITYARILCATALCDDDLHVKSVPLWERVIEEIDQPGGDDVSADHLLVLGATGYGRFCIETGRLSDAEPWLRRAGARAQARGWQLAWARTLLERATATWTLGDPAQTQSLIHEAYPAIAEGCRAHDVSRCWLYFGLIAMSVAALDDAEERLGHAERHWREVDKPLHIHRVLVQRSWVAMFRGDFERARALAAQARELLDAWPRHSWLQYARLDYHVGSIWRADALTDAANVEAKLARAADLKVPAALAVDSVRYTITDADARMRWATHVSAQMLAGAFAVAWEWGNTELTSELIEYHSARGTFTAEPDPAAAEWTAAATAAVPLESADEYALVAAGPAVAAGGAALTRLGPLPPLQMDPSGAPIMQRYRELACERYGRDVTADGDVWPTWP